jgi:putative tryptophan/tyrosine transport system substrate-binding protein
MRRRDFIGAICSVAAGWPSSASAQKASTIKRVAWFGVGRPEAPSAYVDALRAGLREEWLPQIQRVAILARPQHPGEQRERQASEDACAKLGLQLSYFPMPFVPLDDLPRLEGVLNSILESQSEALVVFPDAAMFEASQHIAQFALQNKLPSVSGWAPFARNGLLLSYGPDLREIYHSLATYVDRILRGAKPGDLPVALPTKIEMVVNAGTAKSLGLAVPPTLVARADEVID